MTHSHTPGGGIERGEVLARNHRHSHRHKSLWCEIADWVRGRSEHAHDHDHSDGSSHH